MTEEILTISLSDLKQERPNTLQDLFNDTHFTDITLATADDKQIQAHKIILSSFSPLFKNIILKNPHQKPLIYLKDIEYSELSLVMELIYLGQCQLNSDYLERVLTCAKDLHIVGLDDHNFETQFSETAFKVEVVKDVKEFKKIEKYEDNEHFERALDSKVNTENEDDSKLIEANGQAGQLQTSHKIDYKSSQKSTTECPRCTKKFKMIGNLLNHVKNCQIINETIHGQVILRCHICTKVVQSHTSLNNHIITYHRKRFISCTLCPIQKRTDNGLAKHMKFAHEKRECDVCQVVLKNTKELHRHKDNKHYFKKPRGKRSPDRGGKCSLCQRQFKSRSGLKKHFINCKDYSNMIREKEENEAW